MAMWVFSGRGKHARTQFWKGVGANRKMDYRVHWQFFPRMDNRALKLLKNNVKAWIDKSAAVFCRESAMEKTKKSPTKSWNGQEAIAGLYHSTQTNAEQEDERKVDIRSQHNERPNIHTMSLLLVSSISTVERDVEILSKLSIPSYHLLCLLGFNRICERWDIQDTPSGYEERFRSLKS